MPQTYYEATAKPLAKFPPLKGKKRVDVCVIGAGFTGLGAALALGERGYSVAVLEQNEVGSGASGRNGGQIHRGLRHDQIYLERKFGRSQAYLLWEIAQASVSRLDEVLKKYKIDVERQDGHIFADHRPRYVADSHHYVDHLASHYSYTDTDKLDRDEVRALVRSDDYHGGWIDHGGGHLHPLKYTRGLARAAIKCGAEIFEHTQALKIENGKKARVVTPNGVVTADWVLVAGDSLMGDLVPSADIRILPIASTIGVTKPLGKKLKEYLTSPMAVADSRFVVNYFKPTADGRLFFGGGESYSNVHVDDPGRLVRKAMAQVFPGLADAEFDYSWSGIVGITPTRFPMIRRLAPNVLMAAGYSGQGVSLAPFAGYILAEAVAGTLERFDCLAQLPVPAFPGGTALRHPLMILAMLWYAMRDRL
jgi:gamma-glutamylputrescine oxidase